MTVRVIARLDIKGPNLVKGIHFEGLRVLGAPSAFARHYYEQGIDELLYMDAVASLYGRNSLLDVVRQTAADLFVPLTVGGGVRGVEDARALLRAGADRIAVNTAAIERPRLVDELARRFGSSTVVVSIEVMRQSGGRYVCSTDYGRQESGREAVAWAREAVERGAGELIVTSIEREGTARGFDLDVTRAIADTVSVPVIACGGAGTLAHVVEALTRGGARAVALASVLHYAALPNLGGPPALEGSEGNTDFLRGRHLASRPSQLEPLSVPAIKDGVAAAGLVCRPAPLARVT